MNDAEEARKGAGILVHDDFLRSVLDVVTSKNNPMAKLTGTSQTVISGGKMF